MKSENERKSAKISFRLTPTEKKNMNYLIEILKTNKSEFFRKRIAILLQTVFKNKQDENRI